MNIDLKKFKGRLPYASELYGVYQPLLGWKSALRSKRIESGLLAARNRIVTHILPRFAPRYDVESFHVGLASERARVASPLVEVSGSLIARKVLSSVANAGNDVDAWNKFTREEVLAEMLDGLRESLREECAATLQTLEQRDPRLAASADRREQVVRGVLARESVAAGALHFFHKQGDVESLMALAAPAKAALVVGELMAKFATAWRSMDPRQSQLASAVVSPIGVVHLFRQFFFEFDSFLGPAVEHIWLSPGSTVELIEVSIRRTLTERTSETSSEAVSRSEGSVTQQDELSEAVRSENTSNTKFGVSLNTNNSFGAGPVFNTSIGTGTSFDLDTSQKESRENLHKSLRQQTEKLSTELKRSFKTIFRTVTEATDTKSRRHVIQNTTKALLNYELRRKMRRVGVQVQDLGTHLCWQTYVDKPGDQLCLANLVHIAAPSDLHPTQQPELQPQPDPYKGDAMKHSFNWPYSDDEDDMALYREYIVRVIDSFPKPGFVLKGAQLTKLGGPEAGFRVRLEDERSVAPHDPSVTEKTPVKLVVFLPNDINGEHGKRVPRWDDNPRFDLEIIPIFEPSEWLRTRINDENAAKSKDAEEKAALEHREKLFKAVEERVSLASKIVPRKFEDLREEERIVVYRKLVGHLMAGTGVNTAEPRVRHLFAELIQSMFDVDKMLYFVAPEWWVPHTQHAEQRVFVPVTDQDGKQDTKEREFLESSTVSWEGGDSDRPDNYYITKDSAPAPLGSSLGWTIQLDGDNLRNAFLNAPWVKAVIPIRAGKEQQAFEWLSASNIEGDDGLEGKYEPGDPAELNLIRTKLGLPANGRVTIRNAIEYLIAHVTEKHAASQSKAVDADGVELDYLISEKVYEHGFYTLQGGFQAKSSQPFEVFDQWVEIVPTDQAVPVVVEYNPKTGMMR